MSIRRGGLMSYNQRRIARWYFGGLASSMAAMVTHPIDLIKVLIQTQAVKLSVVQTTRKIVKEQGVLAMYNGISASMLRQYTYTLARFGIYSVGSGAMDTSTMGGKTLLAAIAGGIGGFVGAPADLINVRLQNDVKLPPEKRRKFNKYSTVEIEVFPNLQNIPIGMLSAVPAVPRRVRETTNTL
ncbi:mitochondrial dicarboxylate carrier isoform X3 [Drosophila santomea]|uniref:mitochondrial dicarboxylate carrier isoform X3 n=1 Tax=Drosophila santomea TaxID=129105 RepID=UPI0019543D03|nr:mitochondrial dicarboxylate carrier isoform X3 [Drosophila santomea]